MKTHEVEIAAVHDVDGAGLWCQHIEDVGVVGLAVVDVHQERDIAAQIQHRVQFDRRLGGLEWRPRKQREAQIDGGGVERIGGAVELGAERLLA